MPQQNWLQFISLTLLLSGCSYNPFSSDNHLTGKPVGVAIGTTAGAGAAALAGASKPMVALAGLGGAAVGYYVTTIGFTSGGIKRAGGEVFTQGDCVTIVLPTYSLFENNSADLLPEATPALVSTMQVLDNYPDNDITVAGASSGFDTQKTEKPLTLRRARKLAGYLWAHGTSALRANSSEKGRRMVMVGYGHRFPIANSIEAAGITANSRIQISACPNPADMESNITTANDANVGRLNDNFASAKRVEVTNNDFKADHLPAVPENSSQDFVPVIHDRVPTPVASDLKSEQTEQSDLKQEQDGVLN